MIGIFGGKEVVNYEVEKNKVNLYQEFQKKFNGELASEELLVPLLKWYSNYKNNILNMQKINRHFFYVDKKILNHGVFLLTSNFKFIKYPKKKKNEDDFLIEYIKKYYGWSDREYQFYKDFLDVDEEMINRLDRHFGFDDVECKKFGIKRKKINVKYEPNVKKGWF
jgi:hypothetical protein